MTSNGPGVVERHVDHLVLPVEDLDTAAQKFEAGGYVVTPRADHPFGTSNRLIVFDDTYLELVGVTIPERIPTNGFAAEVASFLDNGNVGVSHAVISGTDAEADHELVSELGLADGPVSGFSRPAPLPNGEVVMARFSMVWVSGDSGTFLCYHHTPGAVWHESALEHPNGARTITSIQLAGDEPALFEALGPVRLVGWQADSSVVTIAGVGSEVHIPGFVLLRN